MRNRSWLAILLSFLFIFTSCSANLKSIKKEPYDLKDQQAYRHLQREQEKKFMDYLSERTVSVEFECRSKEDPSQTYGGRGTGSIVKSKENISYIYTAAHVVIEEELEADPDLNCQIFVLRDRYLNSKLFRIKAEVFTIDEELDIAVLTVPKNFEVSSEMEYSPFPGETAWAVGYPMQPSSPKTKILSITEGALATINVPNSDGKGVEHRVTTQIFFGNSGGGIWNREGKLVGIITSLYSTRWGVTFFYVKPVNEVRGLLERQWKYLEIFG